MKLSSFITTRRNQILETWKESALEGAPRERRMSVARLRDHLGELLEAIARDIDAASRGAPAPRDRAHTQTTWSHVEAVGARHGAGRMHAGITLTEMISEFPALRSVVARLWRQSLPSATMVDLEDLIRFDEALDHALTQSVTEFVGRLDRSRETFLGILGHDLRDPLSTIIIAARLMREEELDLSRAREMADRIVATGERMHQLVVDLLDVIRARIGGRMPIESRELDLGDVIRNIADEFTTVHPERDVQVHISGNLRGYWDDKRMSQAVGNLLANALRHGASDRPIDVSATADESEIAITVHNEGPPIPDDKRDHLFEPFSTATREVIGERKPTRLGLGLYIANAIVGGHGGRIDVESEPEQGTTFTCHLPKGGAPKRSAETRTVPR
jgi:hypothetical protein